MGYRENVQALCDRLGISNDPKIREEDLEISAVNFEIDGEWQRIEGTEWNRAGRLFFQSIYCRVPGARELVIGLVLKSAGEFFAENWDDAEKAGRSMLIAFKKARYVMFEWK
jgi:uncharacterized protein involved in tellurium resistance